ncbi:MAG: cytochrome C [Sphingobacteriia bacterium]|nr:cytochrome C [Sphingobacteriia bacterium]NCC39812.1 cytochrome C [Gammaproteobacteria bacterium]
MRPLTPKLPSLVILATASLALPGLTLAADPVAGAATWSPALGDSDDDHGHYGDWLRPGPDVSPVTPATYTQECGACHLAYQPGLLPAMDWARIMTPTALADHYGEDASLPAAAWKEITNYLVTHGADQTRSSRSRAFAISDSPEAGRQAGELPRISRTPYFLHEHDEIPLGLVTDNPEVRSFSQCNLCHRGAADGVYNEDEVWIPGHGRWDD